MKTYKLLKDWQFSASKLIKEGQKAVINDVLAKALMKDGYIENPNKKTKKIKKDGGTNITTDK